MSDKKSPGYPNGPEEREALAGEYLLGTLSGAERQAFEARLESDADLRAAVAAWSNRLQPLADSVTPATPSPALRRRVLDALSANTGSAETRSAKTAPDAVAPDKIVPLRPSDTKRWAFWTIGLSAAAAIAAALIVMLTWPKAPDVGGYAMLLDKGGKTVLAFQVDHAHKDLIVQASMPALAGGRDYELWIIPNGGTPKSLGVVQAAARDERAIPAEISSLVAAGVTLAISVEPAGGSKTGAPTGPVLFTGTLELADAQD